MSSTVVIDSVSRTDVGHYRAVNEDSLLARTPCFLVADGMGGYEAGDAASAAALGAFSELVGTGTAVPLERIEPVIVAAREAVEAVAATTERGAGTTLSGAVLVSYEDQLYWYLINVGDSRVYLHRGDQFVQLTDDHSLYAELLRAGHSEAEQAPRHVITRALGSRDARHDSWLLPVEQNSRLLICTDGLTGEVSDHELNGILTLGGSLSRTADTMVQRALDAGGRDNVTLVLVEVRAGGEAVAESVQHNTLEILPVS